MERLKNTAKAHKYVTALRGSRIKMPSTNGVIAHIGEHAPISMVNFSVQADAHVVNIILSQTFADASKRKLTEFALHN